MWHNLLQPMASSLSSVTVYLHPTILLLSGLLLSKRPPADKHPQLIPMKLGYHPTDLGSLAWPMALITVEEMWRMQWKRETIGTLKETRCHSETIEVHSWKIVFRRWFGFGLMHPPFWFSIFKSKKATLILLEGNIEDHCLKEASCARRAMSHDSHFHSTSRWKISCEQIWRISL